MSHRRAHLRNHSPDASRAESGDALLQHLRQIPPAPDLSRSIMGRLGYMKLAPGPSRRRQVARWARRSAMALAVVAAMGAAVWIQHVTAPTAQAPTITEAVDHDVRWNVRRINAAIETIRDRLTPCAPSCPPATVVPEPADDPPDLDEIIERSATGPGCWV